MDIRFETERVIFAKTFFVIPYSTVYLVDIQFAECKIAQLDLREEKDACLILAVYGIDLIDVYFLELARVIYHMKANRGKDGCPYFYCLLYTHSALGDFSSFFLGLYLLLLILFNHLKNGLYIHQVIIMHLRIGTSISGT